MNGLKYLITITNRKFAEDYVEFFNSRNFTGVSQYFALGTASQATLDLMGIESAEKSVFGLMVTDDEVDGLKRDMLTQMNISGAGNGIAVFIPVDGVGGDWAKKNLIGDRPINKGEGEMADTQSKLVLIVTIADKGNTERVMEAARSAGATGGTSVRSKGTGASIAKFFGIAISEEKEMIYIVAKRDMRDGIMRAIMEKAGKNTDAHAVVFSLPVDSVCGIGGLED